MKAITLGFFFIFSVVPALAAVNYNEVCSLDNEQVSKIAQQARNEFNDKVIRKAIVDNLDKVTGSKVEITSFDSASNSFQINATIGNNPPKIVTLSYDVIYPEDKSDVEAGAQSTADEAEKTSEIPDTKDAVASEPAIKVDSKEGDGFLDKAKEMLYPGNAPKLDVITESYLAKTKSFDTFGSFSSPNQVTCDVDVHLKKATKLHIYNTETNIPVVDIDFDAKDKNNQTAVSAAIPISPMTAEKPEQPNQPEQQK
jgi:hypothetical protein